ncbi:MAG: hypothetical protein LQ344_005126 [Seirophora lacunosa]|nr:MAG: hypothetical protein LQ344_005126 [Seirophora lacunosa]
MDWNEAQPVFEQPLRSHLPLDCRVRLRHPGYPRSKNTLFLFNAYDHPHGGIRMSFALTACALVAAHTWHGYLSREEAGPPVSEGLDEVLVGKDFVFHNHAYSHSNLQEPCSCISQPYPVYTEFASWPFPHENLPPWWPSVSSLASPVATISETSMAVKERDLSCRITGSAEAGDSAHIIPVRENAWFEDQNMFDYSDDMRSINSAGNQLLLRCDMHRAHEQFKWVIFPNGSAYVYYALDSSVELAFLYHQRKLRPIHGTKPEYLLAAFARAIFPKLSEFLRSRVDKYLLGLDIGHEESTTGVRMDEAWCAERFRLPGRPRSTSPTKRGSPSKEDDGSPRKKGRSALEPLESLASLGKRQRSPECDNVLSDTRINPKSYRTSYRDPRRNGPCICPTLPPSPSASSTPNKSLKKDDEILPSRPSTTCLSDQCRTRLDLNRLDQIRHETLERERLLSDPDGTWGEHLEWAKDPLALQDVHRWLWVHGQEVIDSDFGAPIGLEATS